MGKKPEVLLKAIESFFWGQRFVSLEDVISSYDPVVKGREHLFRPLDVVEQATAGPGEKRTVAIPTEEKPAEKPAKPAPKESTSKKPAGKGKK